MLEASELGLKSWPNDSLSGNARISLDTDGSALQLLSRKWNIVDKAKEERLQAIESCISKKSIVIIP